MEQIDARLASFIVRCDAVAERLNMKRSTVSLKLFMDGKRLDQLSQGKSDVGIGRLAKAERELSALEGAAPQVGAGARAAAQVGA